MSNSDSSDDEFFNRRQQFIKTRQQIVESADFQASSSQTLDGSRMLRIETMSDDVLRIWRQLPEAIRLDPTLLAYRNQYERHMGAGTSKSSSDRNYLVLSLSLTKTGAENDEELLIDELHPPKPSKCGKLYRYTKLLAMVLCWITFTGILMSTSERIEIFQHISISHNKLSTEVLYLDRPRSDRISVTVEGSLFPLNRKVINDSEPNNYLTIWLELTNLHTTSNATKINISDPWTLALLPPEFMDVFAPQKRHHLFLLHSFNASLLDNSTVTMNFRTRYNKSLPLSVAYDLSPINVKDGTLYAAAVLCGLYILIVFEIINRALAAMVASTMSLAILAAMNERPRVAELMSWIDIDTLLLLFSMMILVTVIGDTGIFDYLAVYAFRITGGRKWPLINTLCFFAAIISAFLDNVTTVLLMTPITIRLCEVIQLNPVPILTIMVIYSNIGGALTIIGDPPNVIIASNKKVIEAGINFTVFTLHMSLGVVAILLVIYILLRLIFRNPRAFKFNEPQEVQELRHEIAVWQRAASSMSIYSKDESEVRTVLMKKVGSLLSDLNKKLLHKSDTFDDYKNTLEELREKYPITDKCLLIKSSFALTFVILVFFLHSKFNLTLGWTALLGVLLLLLLAEDIDLDSIMGRVEWSTLIFFAALFILMEALARLGLIAWIGEQTEKVILSVDEDSRLAVAIIIILWVSALASAFVDNVPLTTMMVRIATNLADNRALGLPLPPLIWALAFGACMGGNGTLIGATANVVCAGVAEQHGYRFTFMQFFKIGFPVLITSTTVVTIYLLVVHVCFQWNG